MEAIQEKEALITEHIKEIESLKQALGEVMNKTDALKEGSVQTQQQLVAANKDLKAQVDRLQLELVDVHAAMAKLEDTHRDALRESDSGWTDKVRQLEADVALKNTEIGALKNLNE